MNFKLKNFSVSFFNNDVNNSSENIDKYKLWADYRNKISKFIQKNLAQDMRNIMVFGAGKCNDLDLSYICKAFDEITLTDADIKSMKDAAANQNLSPTDLSKITTVSCDYTTIEKTNFFGNLEQLVKDGASAKDIISFIQESLDNLDSGNILSEYKNKFDVAYSCPVYTQLFYTQSEIFLQILSQYNIYSNKDISDFSRTFKKSMNRILSNYNDLMLSMLTPDGMIIVFTDMIEMPIGSDNLPYIKSLLESSPKSHALLEKAITKNGLAFAKNGCEDLLRKIKAKDVFYALWPFDLYKEYLVCGICGQKTKV